MIEKCADKVTDWLIDSEAITEADRELYKYATYSVLLSSSPLLLAVIYGICLRRVIQSCLIIIPFMIIRKFSGGYHTKHAWTCIIGSNLLLLMCIKLSFYFKCGPLLMLATIGAAVVLIYFSPIDNENRRLEKAEYYHCKKMIAGIIIFFVILAGIFHILQQCQCSVCISIGVMLSAGLQLPCILKGNRMGNNQKRKENVVSVTND